VQPRNFQESGASRLGTLEAQAGALMVQALLARATALARRGRYDSAELVLTRVPRDAPEGLDLLARIRAQQGRTRDAAALWTEALRIDPGNLRFRDCLHKAERDPWSRRTRLLFVIAIAGLLVSAGGFGLERLAARRPQVASQHPAKPKPPVAEQEKHLSFSGPDVIQSRSGAATLLRFESGLFSRDVLLTPGGKASLAAIGRQIEPQWCQLTLTVIGHTDDLPIIRRGRFQDNEALALARADTVIRYLSTVAKIPVSAWVIRRAPDARCLYPCDSIAGRLKNRSVELLIAPSQATP